MHAAQGKQVRSIDAQGEEGQSVLFRQNHIDADAESGLVLRRQMVVVYVETDSIVMHQESGHILLSLFNYIVALGAPLWLEYPKETPYWCVITALPHDSRRWLAHVNSLEAIIKAQASAAWCARIVGVITPRLGRNEILTVKQVIDTQRHIVVLASISAGQVSRRLRTKRHLVIR